MNVTEINCWRYCWAALRISLDLSLLSSFKCRGLQDVVRKNYVNLLCWWHPLPASTCTVYTHLRCSYKVIISLQFVTWRRQIEVLGACRVDTPLTSTVNDFVDPVPGNQTDGGVFRHWRFYLRPIHYWLRSTMDFTRGWLWRELGALWVSVFNSQMATVFLCATLSPGHGRSFRLSTIHGAQSCCTWQAIGTDARQSTGSLSLGVRRCLLLMAISHKSLKFTVLLQVYYKVPCIQKKTVLPVFCFRPGNELRILKGQSGQIVSRLRTHSRLTSATQPDGK